MTPPTRRDFIKTAAATLGMPMILPASALGRDGAVAPSNRIALGAIGIGPRGRVVLEAFLKQPDAQFVTVCDNDYVIRCEGPRVRLWLNGQLTTEFIETDPAIPRTGQIGLQIHSGAPSEAWYQDIEIEELSPAEGGK